MEIHRQLKALNVLYVNANHFPEDITPAFDKPKSANWKRCGQSASGHFKARKRSYSIQSRRFRSLSQRSCRPWLRNAFLPGGIYLCETITNWEYNVPAIRAAFADLLKDLRLDPNGYYIEWYKLHDVVCMVRLNS